MPMWMATKRSPNWPTLRKKPTATIHFAGNGGSSYEEDRRERGQREAKRDEEQRWERLEADVDGDEVDTPEECDRRGEEVMAKGHWRSPE